MTFVDVIDKYGFTAGLIVFILLMFVLPFLRDKWLPWLMKQREVEHEKQLREIQEDVEFKRQIERDRAAAAKVTSDAISSLASAMIQTNERIAAIMQTQVLMQQQTADIKDVLNDAITDMKERVAHRAGYEEGKKVPKTGPLDPGAVKS